MPNYCNFSFKAVGNPDALVTFAAIAKADYHGTKDDPKHFYRVFEFNVEGFDETAIYGWGYCAWSVSSCFLAGGYYDPNNTNNGTHLEKVCKELNISVEFYSTETGMCFSEHILMTPDGLKIDDCVDYYELDKEIELEEFNNTTGLEWTQEEFNKYFEHNDYYEYCEHDLNIWEI